MFALMTAVQFLHFSRYQISVGLLTTQPVIEFGLALMIAIIMGVVFAWRRIANRHGSNRDGDRVQKIDDRKLDETAR
jgi:hypothetical protein